MSEASSIRLANTAGFEVVALAIALALSGALDARAAAPVNDSCAAPVALQLNRTTVGTLLEASNDYELAPSSPCFTGLQQTASTAAGGDSVYSFTAPSTAYYSFKIWNVYGGMNPVLYTAAGCPAATPGIPISFACTAASNRNTGSSEEIMCQSLAAGQQVFLFADRTTAPGGGPFLIQVETCTARESEANDTPGTADLAACTLEGSLSIAGDIDFFAIGAPPAGWRIFAMVETAGSGNNDAHLRITTPTDTLEYDDENNSQQWGLLAPNVAGTPATGAPTFARVTGFAGAAIVEPYRLYTTVQPPSSQAVAESELNDSIASADAAGSNYFSGTLTPDADQDYYSFQATAGDLLYLSLDGDPTRTNDPMDARLALLDAAGAELISADDPGATSNTTPGAGSLTATTPSSPGEALVYRAPSTGTFYARVALQTTPNDIDTRDYLLSITRNCGGSRFKTITPCRAVDTREPDGPVGGPALWGGFLRAFTVAGTCDIPASAKALAINVTAVGATHAGYLAVYAADVANPGTSVVNFNVGATRASMAVVGLGVNGALSVHTGMPAGGEVHLLLDVAGYFE